MPSICWIARKTSAVSITAVGEMEDDAEAGPEILAETPGDDFRRARQEVPLVQRLERLDQELFQVLDQAGQSADEGTHLRQEQRDENIGDQE